MKFSKYDRERIIKLYFNGFLIKQIANKLNRKYKAVQGVIEKMRKAGISLPRRTVVVFRYAPKTPGLQKSLGQLRQHYEQ